MTKYTREHATNTNASRNYGLNMQQIREANRSYADEVRVGALKAKDELQTRYYLWHWSLPYGWTQGDSMDGYSTIAECKRGYRHITSTATFPLWKILKATVIESNVLAQ